MCRACAGNRTSEEEKLRKEELLAQESRAWLAKMETAQTIQGDEPALQLLLPKCTEELPEYAKQPHYLSPIHCRLCLHDCSTDVVEDAEDNRGAEDVEVVQEADDNDDAEGPSLQTLWVHPRVARQIKDCRGLPARRTMSSHGGVAAASHSSGASHAPRRIQRAAQR